MTGPAPIVFQQQGWGESLQKMLAPLAEALMQQQRLRQAQEQINIQRGQFALQQQEQDERIKEARDKKKQLAQQGEALRATFQQQGAPQITGGEMPAAPAVQVPGLGAMPLPPQPTVAAPGVDQRIAASIQNTPPEALPDFFASLQPYYRYLKEDEANRAADAKLQASLSTIEDPKLRSRLEGYIEISRVGGTMPEGVAQLYFGDLLPKGVNPQLMNAALDYARQGQLPWGRVRQQFGIPAMPGGIPDTFVFPDPMKQAMAAQNAQQAKSAQFAVQMRTDLETAKGFIRPDGGNKPVRLTLNTDIEQNLRLMARNGGLAGIGAQVFQQMWRGLLTPEQQQLTDAIFRWGNAFRFQISGQQSSEGEFALIYRSVAPMASDDESTVNAKLAFMDNVTHMTELVASGKATPAELERAIYEGLFRASGKAAADRWLSISRKDYKQTPGGTSQDDDRAMSLIRGAR